jgi:ubiquinone/menaquinone biosynthesis C-methylase UbiE
MGFYRDRVVPVLIDLAMRNRELEPYRRRIVGEASGRVLEIGVGAGANLPFYTARAHDVVGVEPHPRLVAKSALVKPAVRAEMVAGSAEELPFDDRSMDTVVMTFTLCSIPDPAKALREMRRVLKPEGQLLFVEHGLSPDDRVRRWQHRLTPLWKHFTGGCHLDRPIAALVKESGFAVDRVTTGYMPGPKAMTYLYEGVARPVSGPNVPAR